MDTKKIVEQVAHLARLGPYATEPRDKMAREFERILDLFKVLSELEASGAAREAPGAVGTNVASPAVRTNVYREDEAQAFFNVNAIIGNFPDKEASLLKIPKVIDV